MSDKYSVVVTGFTLFQAAFFVGLGATMGGFAGIQFMTFLKALFS